MLNVTNNGPSSFTPGIVTIDQPDFLVSGGTCVEQRGVPVPPGGVCTVTLMFMPMVEGAQEATLTVAEMGSEVGADALKAAKAAVPNELNPVVIDPATELSAELDLPALRALHRADNAGAHTVEAAQAKAWTSASAKNTTLAMMDNAQKNPAAAHLVHIPGFLLLGGGVPIKVGNEVIGAVGVGGAPGGHLDEQCALVALDKVKESLK